MSDDYQKIIQDCIDGQPFGWENFVDKYLHKLSLVAEFAIHESGNNPKDQELRKKVVSRIFDYFASDSFRSLKEFDGQSEFSTYLAIQGRRVAEAYLNERAVSPTSE